MIFCSALDKLIANQTKSVSNLLFSPVSFNVPMPLKKQNIMKYKRKCQCEFVQASAVMDDVSTFSFFFSNDFYYCCCFCLVWMPTWFDMVFICAQFALKFIDGMEMKLNNKLSNITIVWVNLTKWNKKYSSNNIKWWNNVVMKCFFCDTKTVMCKKWFESMNINCVLSNIFILQSSHVAAQPAGYIQFGRKFRNLLENCPKIYTHLVNYAM